MFFQCDISFLAFAPPGVLLCAEQSVIQVCSDGCLESTNRPELHLQSLPEPQAKTLPQPARLDPLSLETTPNSLCTLTGLLLPFTRSRAFPFSSIPGEHGKCVLTAQEEALVWMQEFALCLLVTVLRLNCKGFFANKNMKNDWILVHSCYIFSLNRLPPPKI